MKKLYILFIAAIIVNTVCYAQPAPQPNQFKLKQSLRFEENKGQIADTDGKPSPDVLYRLQDNGMTLFFTKKGLSYQWHYTEELPDGPYAISEATGRPMNEDEEPLPEKNKEPKPTRLHTYRVDMDWIGASEQVEVTAENTLADYTNYYLPHCPDGALNVKSYQKLTYKNMYPNVDVVYYLKDTLVKYDVVVHPGGDLKKVKYTYAGAVPQLINGKVRIETPIGFLEEQPLTVFSEGKKIDGAYHKKKNEISFAVTDYNPTQELVIDPGLLWATYYGDTSSDQGQAVATESTSGDVYLAGVTGSTASIASGGHQNTSGGGQDAFLVKFNSAGVRQWATYYGGTGSDQGSGVAVSSTGEVYLSGNTDSSTSIASGGHQGTNGGGSRDAFLVKFNGAGVRQWGTYYGGTGNDQGTGVAVSSSGDVYLIGFSSSTASIASGGHQNTSGGNNDAFLAKFNSGGVRQWATYYGGASSSDIGYGVAIASTGDIYIAGYTDSPSMASGGHQNTSGGSVDAFLAKFNSSGVRQWATYYGGTGLEYGYSVAISGTGDVYLTGVTSSTASIASGGHQNILGGGYDVFLVKFNSAGIRQWATYYGGSESDGFSSRTGIAVSSTGVVYLSGPTQSITSIASGGHQNTFGGGVDAFLAKFNSAGARQWATYYGGTGNEYGYSIAIASTDDVYIAGNTESANGIAFSGHQIARSENGDAFLAKFPAAGGDITNAEPTAQPTGFVTSNRLPTSATISFTAASGNPSGYLVIRRTGAAPTGAPIDGTSYSVGNTIGDGTVVYAGSAVTFNDTGLSPATQYYYSSFSFNGDNNNFGSIVNYRQSNPLAANSSTVANYFTSFPSNFGVSNVTATSASINFSAASQSLSYLALRAANGIPNTAPVNGVAYSIGDVLGNAVVVYLGTVTNFQESNLLPSTSYGYKIFPFAGSGSTANYFYFNGTAVISSSLDGTVITGSIAAAPTAQPTNLLFNTITTSSFNVSYTAATGNPTGYLVLRRTGLAPTGVPALGVAYSVGNAIGDGEVAYVGSATTFSQTGFIPSTEYFYRVFSYNGSAGSTNYLTTNPLSGSQVTAANLATEPIAQPTGLVFSAVTNNSLAASFTQASGAPAGYLVIRRTGAAPTGSPVDATTYTLNQTLGDGTVVYNGSLTNFNQTGLAAATFYHYRIFSYNGSGITINYLTSGPLIGNKTTLADVPTTQPTALQFSAITATALTGSFTAATGSPTSYLILRKAGSATTATPVNGTAYSAGATLGDATVVGFTGNSFSETGLTPGTIYFYSLFSLNGTGEAIVYRTTSPLTGSVLTVPGAPVASAASTITLNSFTANWNAATGASSYKLDVSADNFVNLVTGYNAKVVTSTSDAVTGLQPNTNYQYRVKAVNASGESGNSNIITQLTAPAAPVANAATNVNANDFKATWASVAGVTSYELSVSSNNFATTITGYGPKQIPSSLTEETVFGLSPSTQYQYRVVAVNGGGKSPNSNTITVSTGAGVGTTPLAVSNVQAPASVAKNATSIAVTATVSGGSSSKTAKLFYRKILGSTFSEVAMTNSTGSTFAGNIPSTGIDEIGSEFYVRAESGSEAIESAKSFVYVSTSATEASAISSITKFGGTLESYQIISIPVQLEDNLISTIFEPALGAYDKTKWRLVRYQNGRNTDYQAGLTRINQGESYWFNSIQSATIKPGAGTTPQFNQSKPFVLKLLQGWNQIATPFPFNIDWDDVLAANGNPTGIGKYKVYVPGSASFAESNNLQSYSGGFVFADQAKDLNLPVTLKNTAGGRKATNVLSSDIGKDEWMVPITLSQGKALNPLGAVGMHPQAQLSKDDFDDITLPRFIKHLEFNSYHEDFIAPRFSKDIVPTADKHVWNIAIESNFDERAITMSWAGLDLGSNEAQLILFDQAAGVLVDMKKVTSYQLRNAARQDLQIIYHRDKKMEVGSSLLLGQPFPNPSSGEVTFNLFSATPTDGQLEIVDLMGQKMIAFDFSLDGERVNAIRWSGTHANEAQVAPGIYIYKIVTSSKTIQGRILIK